MGKLHRTFPPTNPESFVCKRAGMLPPRGNDGAKLRPNCRNHALCGGFCRRQNALPKDVQAVHSVLGAAQSAAPL